LMRRALFSAHGPGIEPRALRRCAALLLAGLGLIVAAAGPAWPASEKPVPLMSKGGAPVDWWFAFKFSSQNSFAGCGADTGKRACIFGGTVQAKDRFGQQFAFASSRDNALSQGKGCVGATTTDPIGATFDQVYNGNFNYVIWNDQFYGDPIRSNDAPWAHSKGLLAWNDAGEGFVMQVSTPSWPGQYARLRQQQQQPAGKPAFLRPQARQGRSDQGVDRAQARRCRDRPDQTADRAQRRAGRCAGPGQRTRDAAGQAQTRAR
jgi:hypothetical protein